MKEGERRGREKVEKKDSKMRQQVDSSRKGLIKKKCCEAEKPSYLKRNNGKEGREIQCKIGNLALQ